MGVVVIRLAEFKLVGGDRLTVAINADHADVGSTYGATIARLKGID